VKRGTFKRPVRTPKPIPPYTLTREVKEAVNGFAGSRPKDEPYRSRALLNLAHAVHECQNCDRYVETGCEPAHANGAEWGKGMSRKADDWAHAALCNPCHSWLDQLRGAGDRDPTGMYAGNRHDRHDMWTRAHFRTMSHYWRNNWLRIA
jgi:hypothetical protein